MYLHFIFFSDESSLVASEIRKSSNIGPFFGKITIRTLYIADKMSANECPADCSIQRFHNVYIYPFRNLGQINVI